MNKESMALTLAGGLIGILALSAGAFAELHPPKAETLPAALAGETEPASAAVWMAGEASDAALPVLAEPEPAAGETEAVARSVAVSASDPIPEEKLFVWEWAVWPEIVRYAESRGIKVPTDPPIDLSKTF